jgi:exoribonuclease R
MGRIKAIVKSPNFEKEHLVTLMPIDKGIIQDRAIEDLKRLNLEKKNATSCGIFAVPVSKKLPWMAIANVPKELIEDLKAKKKPNHRYYIVKMKSWNSHSIRPACNVLSSIGEAGNLDAESLRLLKSHDIWSDEYETEGQGISEKVHESLRIFTKDIDPISGEWIIHPDEIKRRVDLRERRIFTIDPITAKDLDDALSIEKISDFIYEIGVHIADVSYFVQ